MTAARPFIETAVGHVLSSMCFASPEFIGAGEVRQSLSTSVQFAGEVCGHLRLAINEQLARRLAADFLGTESADVTIDVARSFSLELSNIVCGSALAEVASGRSFNISLPASLETSGEIYPYCFSIRGVGPELGIFFQIDEASLVANSLVANR